MTSVLLKNSRRKYQEKGQYLVRKDQQEYNEIIFMLLSREISEIMQIREISSRREISVFIKQKSP